MDRFDNMRVFAKVVESASFTGAAARLSMSASMFSQHVKELEERLGARLLNRTTRKVSLTETGRAYYERCTRLLADLEETEQAVTDMHAAPRGELRVNAAPTFGILQLAPGDCRFHRTLSRNLRGDARAQHQFDPAGLGVAGHGKPVGLGGGGGAASAPVWR